MASLETNFNVSPYFDDFDEEKNFYRVLFRPSVAVQARELTQLQTILQTQIERFGNHVFKSGTIISGVNFDFLSQYFYAKILDLQLDGQDVDLANYVNLHAKNANNLIARVVNYKTGYQSQSPNLNTIYLQYINSGNTGTESSFAADQILEIYDPSLTVEKVTITNGGTSYSNSDSIVFVSALLLSNISGTFTAGQVITQGTSNATIIEVNTSIVTGSTILKIKPIAGDLTNSTITSAKWTFSESLGIAQGSNTANISILGSGATASLATDSSGTISTITMTTKGTGYLAAPHVTVKTAVNNASAPISTTDLTAQIFKAKVTVANTTIDNASGAAPVGNGYAFSVSEGVIYQKGFFERVDPQTIIVEKYSSSPNNVVVGFVTAESIVNSNSDSSLLDNATGSPNESAPGAHRLKLTPTLNVVSKSTADANTTFFPLVEWRDGAPYKQNKVTIYNSLGDEFARRTFESSGNYVIDRFDFNTKDISTSNVTHTNIVIDPGTAYVQGQRVETLNNTFLAERRGTNTAVRDNRSFTFNLGNYIRVNEFVGNFAFKTGSSISLRDATKTAITSRITSITASGDEIGTAKIRSLVYDSGEPGTPSCVYRLYLFDVSMNSGRNFNSVRAVFFDGTNDGIADVVTETDPTTSATIVKLYDTEFDTLLFPTGLRAIGGANGITDIGYSYRTTNESATITTSGTVVISTGAGEVFPYTAGQNLTTTQKADLILVPQANVEMAANLTGTVTTSSNTTITGSSTSFTSELAAGDYIRIKYDASTNTEIRRVVSINSGTSITIDSNTTYTASTKNYARVFPAFIPVPIQSRSNRTANVDSGGTTLTIDLFSTTAETTSGSVTGTVTYNVKKSSATAVAKSVSRGNLVKINTNTHGASASGPWSLGISDVVRLKGVYMNTTTNIATMNTTNSTDVTKHFFVNDGQTKDYYGLASLVKTGTISTSNVALLIEFDTFTHSAEGFKTFNSYSINDTATLAASTSTINTVEIPEFKDQINRYYDLRDVFEFRPKASNTVVLTSNTTLANTNPSNTVAFSASDKLFPVPDSTVTFDAEFYLPRIDSVYLDKEGNIKLREGTPAIVPLPPITPRESFLLSQIRVQPYPSLPTIINSRLMAFLNKRVGQAYILNERLSRIQNSVIQNAVGNDGQFRRYSMRDIAQLERRIQSLEYYTTLNLLEKSMKDLIIPSSVSPTLNRFKNGFVIDNFQDYLNSETGSNQYRASVRQADSVLTPHTKVFNIECEFNTADTNTNDDIVGKMLLLPYNEEELDQNNKIATSTINSLGVQTIYSGTATSDPQNFRIVARVETVINNPVAPYYAWGGGWDGGAGNHGADTRSFGSDTGFNSGVGFEGPTNPGSAADVNASTPDQS